MKEITINNSQVSNDINKKCCEHEKKGEVHHLANGAVIRVDPSKESIRDTEAKTIYTIETKPRIHYREEPFGEPFKSIVSQDISLKEVSEQEILGDKIRVSVNAETGEFTLWYHDKNTGETKKRVIKSEAEYQQLLQATQKENTTVSELMDKGIITADEKYNSNSTKLSDLVQNVDWTKINENLDKNKSLVVTEA
ncbi:MAG: hypothetical protein MK033_11015 [Candidatus Caenarcaniphilales bacterium]|nr:hypothetical protein [Candidatus Caenarcaniphilales bacterium]